MRQPPSTKPVPYTRLKAITNEYLSTEVRQKKLFLGRLCCNLFAKILLGLVSFGGLVVLVCNHG